MHINQYTRALNPVKKRHYTERFFDHIGQKTQNGCIPWMAALDKDGYGGIWSEEGQLVAHRVAYEIAYGNPPKNLLVLHKCDNPSCVNPSHLFLGSHDENMKDMKNKSRQSKGEKQHCAKMTKDKVELIRYRYANESTSQAKLAAEFGISQVLVSQIVLRRIWKHIS
jgi:hypothetical protein